MNVPADFEAQPLTTEAERAAAKDPAQCAVDELINAAQSVDADGNQLPQTITWENPHVLLLDSMSGSGYMVSYEGTVTLPFDRDRLKLDARNVGNGYSWSDEVTGGLYSNVSTTVTITEGK